jgi:hypothetical protein
MREYVEGLWQVYRSYCPDPDFVKKAQISFEAMLWQMRLACLLRDRGRDLGVPGAEGPDIPFGHAGRRYLMEAVAASNGAGPDAVPDRSQWPSKEVAPGIRMFQPVYGRMPDDRVMLRVLTAIDAKSRQYLKWVADGVVRGDEPFIAAVNAGMVEEPFGDEYSYGARCVFAIGPVTMSVPVNLGTGKADVRKMEAFLTPKPFVTKVSGATTSSGIFLDRSMSHVSALTYTHHHTANSCSMDGRDVELILNPFAAQPVPPDLLGFGKVTRIEFAEDGTRYRVVKS